MAKGNIKKGTPTGGTARRVNTDWELRELYIDLDIGADIGMDWTCSKNGSGKDS